MTVAELQEQLAVTRNAVMLPLGQLEQAGLVRRAAVQRDGKVGKPSRRFELVPEPFERMSNAYQAIAPHLLGVIGRPEATDIDAAMKAVGRRMHSELSAEMREPIDLKRATDFLQEQGAEIEIRTDEGDTLVLSHSCPIGKLVRTDHHICDAIAAFLGFATGRDSVSQCHYADKFTCQFRLRGHAAKDAQA
jgi:predicted ArsR family transcriptional regulator